MKRAFAAVALLSLLAGCGTTGGVMETAFPSGVLPQQLSSQARQAAVQGRLMVLGGGTGNTMKPGQPARWEITIFDGNTGAQIGMFDQIHEKFMHLIAVSSDLSSFAHIHPNLADGGFDLPVNQPNGDPDNQDAANAVTKPGAQLLFAEVKPQGQDPALVRMYLTAEGQEQPLPLKLDPVSPSGAITKFFTADSAPGKKGDAYQITLTTMKMSGMVHLTFNVQSVMKMGSMVHYMPVTDLEPWLGMPGHAILISQNGQTVDDKVFRHLHAGHHMGGHDHGGGTSGQGTGPDVMFMLMGADLVPAGVYKLWGQFKHHDKVLTLPFVIQL